MDLLIRIGYGGSRIDYGEIVGRAGDEGIDGIIKEDKFWARQDLYPGQELGKPGRSAEIQKFVGALQGKRAKKGIFITTSSFSKEAIEYARSIDTSLVVLLDGTELAELMIDNELGISVKETYKTYRVDSDYFEE